jgi:hypothetical protein
MRKLEVIVRMINLWSGVIRVIHSHQNQNKALSHFFIGQIWENLTDRKHQQLASSALSTETLFDQEDLRAWSSKK